MFGEKRKYFDYELAYEGYLKAKELFDKGGVEELINDEEFDISGGATIEEWSCNGYLPLYASGYNITLYLGEALRKIKAIIISQKYIQVLRYRGTERTQHS